MGHHLKNHEKFIREALKEPETDLNWLLDYHKTWIEFMQHERLIHLMVTIAVAIFMIVVLGISMLGDNFYFLIPDGILMILLVFYLVHYYRLENGVQRWYALYDEIVGRLKIKGEDHV